MSLVIKLVALVVREVQDELRRMEPVILEEEGVRFDPRSTTAAETERAPGWDHDKRHPVGFG